MGWLSILIDPTGAAMGRWKAKKFADENLHDPMEALRLKEAPPHFLQNQRLHLIKRLARVYSENAMRVALRNRTEALRDAIKKRQAFALEAVFIGHVITDAKIPPSRFR